MPDAIIPTQNFRGISLRTVLSQVQFTKGQDIVCSAISTTEVDCEPGDLFIPEAEDHTDLLSRCQAAIERGAAAILTEQLLPLAIPQAIVPDAREALGIISHAIVGNPSAKMRTIGITGSHGKTATAMLVASVLEAASQACGVISSLGYSDSIEQVSTKCATPRSPKLAWWMSRMVKNKAAAAVIEMSSQGLSQRRTAGTSLDIAVLTNLRNVHTSEHGSAANYLAAKKRIFSHLKPGGLAIINADDHRSRQLLESLACPTLTVGLHAEADISARVIDRSIAEQRFTITAGDETIQVRSRIIGDAHVANCLSAVAVGLSLGIELSTIVRGIENVTYLPGRMQRLEVGQEFGVIVDAASTPDTLAIALKTARRVTKGRVLLVFSASGEKNRDARPMLARVAEQGADLAVITSGNPRRESPREITHQLLDGFHRPAKAHFIPTRAEAIRWALGHAQPGDCVLICGHGDRTSHLVGTHKVRHDDREVALTWLYESGQRELAKPQLKIFG
ncbi:UDP-N-acetylmuramyl-tripeptide synthetase [Pirellula staleyi DSM 6068]|uniref:UDP-N-acetylmuramyl-tripeptide synthetase n=1 Tax=Pirellula staleyi (strain ATCC 27377 / DSM 6068 / ICPB 4128) TaxID=530564 RepID=D2R179_PIRSD|nr:UDP-N-acetylmuramoyl-L-alanyl-D-glutamate--2,6-diaminopimelate ligase [Pirellula staleyi]ADB18564.1 UDP-N-acetylmuramyl-tripeptide synthetase [Pirellula staleyi DSM 6068]